MFQICADAFTDHPALTGTADGTADTPGGRKRRSSTGFTSQGSTPSLGPRMLTVAVIQSRVVNQAPVVHNASYTVLEDGATFTFTISYTDPEGDRLRFWLSEQPRHGSATVTSDGAVSYTPDPNFAGADVIHISGRIWQTDAGVFLLTAKVKSSEISCRQAFVGVWSGGDFKGKITANEVI